MHLSPYEIIRKNALGKALCELVYAASEMILEDNKFSYPISGEEPLIKTNYGSITCDEYYNETRKPYLAECPSK